MLAVDDVRVVLVVGSDQVEDCDEEEKSKRKNQKSLREKGFLFLENLGIFSSRKIAKEKTDLSPFFTFKSMVVIS